VNVFGFYDDAERAGFQAALHRVDGTQRPSALAVKQAIETATCGGEAEPCAPAVGVIGAGPPRVLWDSGAVALELTAAEGATAVVCVLPGTVSAVSVRRLLRAGTPPGCTATTMRANLWTPLRVATPASARFTVGVGIVAEANAKRGVYYAL
jgi:hypothetical protein